MSRVPIRPNMVGVRPPHLECTQPHVCAQKRGGTSDTVRSTQMPRATGDVAPFGENYGSNIHGNLPGCKKGIAVKELLPIVLACALWGPLWAHKHVEVQCDNAVVVDILRAKTSKCKDIMHLLRCLHFCTAKHDIRLKGIPSAGSRKCCSRCHFS